jgi:hypothetical protein
MGDPKPAGSEEAEIQKPKAGDIIGGALGGRFGGLGRRKQSDNREQMPQKTENKSEGGMLMEMTIETLQTSTAAVDATKLAVPGGYQQVENDMLKALNRRR